MKLFLLPYAGGSSNCYHELIPHLAYFIEPVPLELPGHGRRIREPLLTDMNHLIDDLFSRIARHLDQAYAFFGHSMGALLGFLLSRRAFELGYPMPRHLFLSGHAGPENPHRKKRCHHLAKQQFLQEVIQLGGTPPEVAASRELLDFFEPILRADFTAIENYCPTETLPLNVAATVMMGRKEPYAVNPDLPWLRVLMPSPRVLQFDGRHFFVLKHWQSIGSLISATLAASQENAEETFLGISESYG